MLKPIGVFFLTWALAVSVKASSEASVWADEIIL
jgi:hypothetical protein